MNNTLALKTAQQDGKMESKTPPQPKIAQQDKKGDEGVFEMYALAKSFGAVDWVVDNLAPMFKQAGLKPEFVEAGIKSLSGEGRLDKLDATTKEHSSIIAQHDTYHQKTQDTFALHADEIQKAQKAFSKMIEVNERRIKALDEANITANERISAQEARIAKLEQANASCCFF